jgi:tetratricopeptide (TPR) repeat protein
MKHSATLFLLISMLLIVSTSAAVGQSTSRRGKPIPKPTVDVNAEFDKAVKAGDEARIASRLDEAIEAYDQAVRLRPKWPDGWWYLGAIYYEKDQYAQGRDAFLKLLALEPDRGQAWGLLGLCQYQTREYEPSVIALQHARSLGFNGNQELESVVRYHTALLYIRFEQFEIAYDILREFLRAGNAGPKIVEAFGLTILRMAFLPNEIPPDKRDEVLLAGQAGLSMGAQQSDDAHKAFDSLVARYPDDPNVHYSFGVFLLRQDADAALVQFKRALELQPLHQPAMVQMAFEYLKRGEYNDALPLAEKAVQLAPKMYPARNVLGRVLLELGQLDRSINQLEEGVRLAPSIPEMHFALARAYTRAGRKQDADRERDIFKKLQEQYSQKNGAAQTGNSPTENPEKPNPQ